MPYYFMRDTPLQALEQLMMSTIRTVTVNWYG